MRAYRTYEDNAVSALVLAVCVAAGLLLCVLS